MSTSRSIRTEARAERAPAACWLALAVAAIALGSAPAGAHGFGERYDLPLPLSFYLFGTAAAIVFSFVIVGVFVRRGRGSDSYPRFDLRRHGLGRLITSPIVSLLLKLVVLGLSVLAVLAGFLGNPDPYQNIAPTLVWIIGWVGLAYVSAFIGNLWATVNPWRTVFDFGAGCYRRARRGHGPSRHLPYPEWLGVWPAFALLLAFSWTELVYPSPAVPVHLAWLLVGYSLLTWTGMVIYGGEAWLRHGEVFTVVFSLFARFAPTEVRVVDPALCARCDAHCRSAAGPCIDCYDCLHRARSEQWELSLRPFAAGLLDSRPVSVSMTALVLLVLSTVLYDGALGTPEWGAIETVLVAHMPALGELAPIAVRTIGLAAFWALFFGAYLAVSATIGAVAATGRSSTWEIARSMATTLVPIAIAYHLAHYLVYLLVQGQYIVPLLSDPFGYGWNLLATAGYRVKVGIVGARFAWYAAVTAIVVGHIVAVYLAHARSMRIFATRRAALRSEVPLTALMVVYTFVSLSILAEPITERRPSAQPATSAGAVSVPEDAVLPEAGTGRLQSVGAGRSAKQKLTYRLLGSAFQDGTPMGAADILYAYMFAYRWGVKSEAETAHYDPVVDAATAPLRQHLAGVKFIGTDTKSKSFRVAETNVVRELFIVDVYTTTTPEDPEQDAAQAPPWSTLPWHLTVLMEEAVSRGWAAFSQAEAERRGVAWLDLVRSDPLNRQLASLVATFERDGYRPDSLREMVSVDEARSRWAALAAFYQAHGHFLVTNGPYALKAWTADSVSLSVFRDLSYPLGVGSFDAYAIPRRGFITKVEQTPNRLRLFADIETIMKFQRSYDIVRAPLQSVLPDAVQRAAVQCRYIVLDAQDNVALAGSAPAAADATFQIDFDGKLGAGRYTVVAEITVSGNTMNADIARIPLQVAPKR